MHSGLPIRKRHQFDSKKFENLQLILFSMIIYFFKKNEVILIRKFMSYYTFLAQLLKFRNSN